MKLTPEQIKDLRKQLFDKAEYFYTDNRYYDCHDEFTLINDLTVWADYSVSNSMQIDEGDGYSKPTWVELIQSIEVHSVEYRDEETDKYLDIENLSEVKKVIE